MTTMTETQVKAATEELIAEAERIQAELADAMEHCSMLRARYAPEHLTPIYFPAARVTMAADAPKQSRIVRFIKKVVS